MCFAGRMKIQDEWVYWRSMQRSGRVKACGPCDSSSALLGEHGPRRRERNTVSSSRLGVCNPQAYMWRNRSRNHASRWWRPASTASANPASFDPLVKRVAYAPHTKKSALFSYFPSTSGVFLHEQVVRKSLVDTCSGRAHDGVTAMRSRCSGG